MSGSLSGDATGQPGTEEGLRRPRVLGDAWQGWEPSQGTGEASAHAGPFLLVALHGLVAFSLIAVWSALAWLAVPRVAQAGFGPGLVTVVWAAGAVLLFVPALLMFLLICGLPLPRWLSRPLRTWVFLLWSPASRAARLFGVSRDRTSHAFLLVANRLAWAGKRSRGEGILVLAPRCLRPDLLSQLRSLAGRSGARIAVVAGGEEARAAVFESPPAGILAIACERDLVAGVRELADRFLVLCLPNRRPEGPCRNSEIDLEEAGRMIAMLSGRSAGR